MATQAELRVALKRFMALAYPKGCSGRNVYGIELVMLDADIYGIAQQIAGGKYDPRALNILGSLELHAQMVLHALKNEAHLFYDQSRELARMALDLVPVERGPVVRLVEAVIASDSPDPDVIASHADVINVRAFGCDTALTTAARLGREAWCRALLDAGADLLLSDGYWTPLVLAAVSGQVTTLQMLLEAGGDPNREDDQGDPPRWTPPLWWAIYHEREAAVGVLLEHGADPWIKDSEGRDSYDFAAENDLVGIAERIAKAREKDKLARPCR